MAKVFVSYSRKDIEFAKHLTGELQKSDLDFWVDWEGIPPTVDWWKQIEKGIEEADVFLFLISPDSAKSKICGQEIDTAVKNGKRIIPLVVRDIKGDETPKQLSHLNWIFFREQDEFDASIQKLLIAIHTDYDWVTIHRRLQTRALEWQRSYKEKSLLLRGKDLRQARIQFRANSTKEPRYTDLQKEYLSKSRKAQTAQRMFFIAITILIALFVTGFIAYNTFLANLWANDTDVDQGYQGYYYSAKDKSAQQLVVIANFLLKKDPKDQTVPVLLAVQALNDPHSYDEKNILTTENDEAIAILQNYVQDATNCSTSTCIRELIDQTCAKLPRNLTQTEWIKYFGKSQSYEATCPNLPVGE